MNQRPSSAPSYLFTVRLWSEDLGQGQTEWRGVVKHVSSGEEHFFRDWGTLGQLLEEMVGEGTAPPTTMIKACVGAYVTAEYGYSAVEPGRSRS